MEKEISKENRNNQKIDLEVLKKLLPLLKPHIKSLILCGVLLAVFSLLSLAGPLLIRHAIDVNMPQKDLKGLLLTAFLFSIILIISFIVNYYQQVRLEIIGQRIIKGIRINIFTHLTQLSQSFFDKNPVGKLLSRVESDTEALRTLFTATVVTILSDILLMVGMYCVMFVLSPRLALVLLFIAPLVVFVVKYFNGRIVPIFIEVRLRTAEVYSFLEEYLRGSRIVQAFSQENNVTDRMNAVNESKFNVEYPGEKLSNYFGHLVFLLSTIASVLILGLGGYWILQKPEDLTIGTLVAFLGYIQRFFGPIFHLSEQINVIQRAFAGAKRIHDVMEIPSAESQTLTRTDDAADPPVNVTGVEFRNIWFAYKDNEWVLKNVSFKLEKGTRIAIVGATGSGKTTLISLLLRFYEPQKGQILLNGQNIRTISLARLRKEMGLVLQDIVLFPGTLYQNLSLEQPGISRDDVLNALDTVNARDLVQRNPLGLDAIIAEHGGHLSMGERQLISFARALVFNPNILILDEATSSVDPLTEQRVQQAVDTLLAGRTSLVIAHRLQTIINSDLILVMQNGEIIEQGSHSFLLNQNGTYKQLYDLQLGNGKVLK